jgi:hypothetical protein
MAKGYGSKSLKTGFGNLQQSLRCREGFSTSLHCQVMVQGAKGKRTITTKGDDIDRPAQVTGDNEL